MKTTTNILRIVSGFFALVSLSLTTHAMPRDNAASTVETDLKASSSRQNPLRITSSQERLKDTFLTDVSMKVSCQISAAGTVESVNVIRRGRDRELNASMLTSLKQQNFSPVYVKGVAVAHEEVLTLTPADKI